MTDEGQLAGQVLVLSERLIELELQLQEQSWERLSGQFEREFSRAGLREINRWARLMWLKNPLIRRGVNVQALYVFGQGVNIRARDPVINEVIQGFLDDEKNRAELTSHAARESKEIEQSLFSNTFFVFFVNRATGRVRVRTIGEDEIEEIVCNPEDAKEPWLYKRVWNEERFDLASGTTSTTQQTAYYPDWLYWPAQRAERIGGQPVRWGTPVYHVKTGGLSDMRFGVSEVYSAIDWAKAYKAFLEDWATLTRAYSRFAHKMTVPGGKPGIAAAKAKLGTTVSTATGGVETNPPPTVGSVFIGQPGVDLQPLRIGGANVSAEDGRRILLMVAAATGLPESFFGDVSVGTLATAKSLDRPTELQMRSRQTFWADVFRSILRFVIRWAVQAPGGSLKGQIVDEDDGTPKVTVFGPDGDELDTTIDVDFPPILEHDIEALIRGTVTAATLDGKPLAGTMDGRTLSRLLLTALGVVQDADELIERLWPEDSSTTPPNDGGSAQNDDGASDQVAEAIRGLREALQRFVARLEGPDEQSTAAA